MQQIIDSIAQAHKHDLLYEGRKRITAAFDKNKKFNWFKTKNAFPSDSDIHIEVSHTGFVDVWTPEQSHRPKSSQLHGVVMTMDGSVIVYSDIGTNDSSLMKELSFSYAGELYRLLLTTRITEEATITRLAYRFTDLIVRHRYVPGNM